jgi:hypothetical protein
MKSRPVVSKHTLAEILEWADRWVKNRPAARTAEGSVP